MRFDGAAYDVQLDQERLTHQLRRIYLLMRDGQWRTLKEIEQVTHDPQPSISAQLRHLRKPRFGSHVIEKRRRGEGRKGLWEYRLLGRVEQTEMAL